jgi:hypothetical protein
MQFDLGSVRSDIVAVRIVGPGASALTFASLPSGLRLYLSTGTNFTAGTLCEANITISVVGEEYLATCPLGTPGRYVTLYQPTHSTRIALQEVVPMYEGGWGRAGELCSLPRGGLKGPCLMPIVEHSQHAGHAAARF